MKTKIIEAANGPMANHGKFLLGQPDVEWQTRSALPLDEEDVGVYSGPLLRQLGWGPEHVWVLDLQTGEGAYFRPGGYAKADLDKHKIWVCPLFEPFLTWLYTQDLADLDALPAFVELPDAPFEMAGYRRAGQ